MNKATGFICKYILLQLYSFAFGFLKRIHVDIHLQITISVKLSLNAAQYNLIKLSIFLIKIRKTLLLLDMQDSFFTFLSLPPPKSSYVFLLKLYLKNILSSIGGKNYKILVKYRLHHFSLNSGGDFWEELK